MRKIETPNAQRAVWRKRGSGSPESLCEFGSFCARPSVGESPACAKPLGRCASVARALSKRYFVPGNQYSLKMKCELTIASKSDYASSEVEKVVVPRELYSLKKYCEMNTA